MAGLRSNAWSGRFNPHLGIKGHIESIMRQQNVDIGSERLVMAIEDAYARAEDPLPTEGGSKALEQWVSRERKRINTLLGQARRDLQKAKKEAAAAKAKAQRMETLQARLRDVADREDIDEHDDHEAAEEVLREVGADEHLELGLRRRRPPRWLL